MIHVDVSDIGGQGDKSVPYAKRPCVGLCYILKMKAKGIKVMERDRMFNSIINMTSSQSSWRQRWKTWERDDLVLGSATATGLQKPRLVKIFFGQLTLTPSTWQGLPGFVWKHPKQEAKERKEKEREEKKERVEKEKALETAGKEISASKNWI